MEILKYILLTIGILLSIIDTDACAQDYRSSPYFTVGAYHIDGRHTANGLDISDDFVDAICMGIGYEFRISDPWGILIGGDFAISSFHDSYSEDFKKIALLSISTSAVSLSLSPRYYLVFDDETSFFFGLLSRIESTSSVARFKFRNKDDVATPRGNSGFQLQHGLEFGIRFSLSENVDNSISLGFVSRDYGSSINKLDLKQSGYFRDETMKQSTSLEIKTTFYINKN